MRLSCPNCQTEYEVPDAALTGRARTLRCAQCMTKWQAPALDLVPAEPAMAAPAFDPPASDAAMLEEAAPATTDASMAEDDEEISEPPNREWVSMLQTSRETPAPAKPAPSQQGLRISILLLLLIIAALLAEHRVIGELWPPSQRLFNALGLY